MSRPLTAHSCRPRYRHDCDACVFVGVIGEYDLYLCEQGGDLPTIVARFSPDEPDYLSGPDLYLGELRLARTRDRFYTADRDIEETL